MPKSDGEARIYVTEIREHGRKKITNTKPTNCKKHSPLRESLDSDPSLDCQPFCWKIFQISWSRYLAECHLLWKWKFMQVHLSTEDSLALQPAVVVCFYFLPCSLFPHAPHMSWALLSTTASPLRTVGLYYLEDACRVLFVQIAPFAHTVKTLQFSLVETCPNSVAYFKDLKLHINGIYFNSKWKNPGAGGFKPLPVEAKNLEAHALPSELAGPGYSICIS